MSTPDLIQQQRQIVRTFRQANSWRIKAEMEIEARYKDDLAQAVASLKQAQGTADSGLLSANKSLDVIRSVLTKTNLQHLFEQITITTPNDFIESDPVKELERCTAVATEVESNIKSILVALEQLRRDETERTRDEAVRKQQEAKLLQYRSYRTKSLAEKRAQQWLEEKQKLEYQLYLCPQCGDKVNSFAKFCPHCGSRLVHKDAISIREATVKQLEYQRYTQQVKNICSQCGDKVDSSAKFCPHCGNRLVYKDAIAIEEPNKKRQELKEAEKPQQVLKNRAQRSKKEDDLYRVSRNKQEYQRELNRKELRLRAHDRGQHQSRYIILSLVLVIGLIVWLIIQLQFN